MRYSPGWIHQSLTRLQVMHSVRRIPGASQEALSASRKSFLSKDICPLKLKRMPLLGTAGAGDEECSARLTRGILWGSRQGGVPDVCRTLILYGPRADLRSCRPSSVHVDLVQLHILQLSPALEAFLHLLLQRRHLLHMPLDLRRLTRVKIRLRRLRLQGR